MGSLTLGLDLGTNSIGWALVDRDGERIVETGVRVFPEGVDRDTKGGEVSKNEARRLARAARRQTRRRAARRKRLRKALVAAKLLPAVALLPRDDPERVAWERDAFRDTDPYTLRQRAPHERLEPYELGRVLLHLAQRRGFLSNRRTDRDRGKETSDLLEEIGTLEAELNGRTLGEHLAGLRSDDPAEFHRTRLRGKHTNRRMYETEFETIWEAQKRFHPGLLTDELKYGTAGAGTYPTTPDELPAGDDWLTRYGLHGLIFFQRELLPPSPGLIGRCELDARLPRCPRGDRRAQRLRLHQEVNNLRVIDTSTRDERPLTEAERETLIGYLAPKKDATFDAIRKKLFERPENVLFNLERGGRTKLHGIPVDAELANKKRLGPTWHRVDESIRDNVVAAIVDDDAERLRHHLDAAGFAPICAEELLETPVESGYASYSLHAIKRLLPHVARGLPLTSRDKETPCALREAGFLMPWEHVPRQKRFLEDPPNVTNPIVRRALHEVRKVVNAILRELVYPEGHELTAIHLELAREVRGTSRQRAQQSIDMRKRERERENAAARIREHDRTPNRNAILRYLLWEQQDGQCVYSGEPISIAKLFGGEVDVDHVLPYSKTLDDSQMNKVLVFRAENDLKGNRTVHEWLAGTDPAKYEMVLQRAKRLPYPKLKRFYQETVERDDFIARQLVETAYITTQVQQYLRCLGVDPLCPKGMHTSTLRHLWGLDTILEELRDVPALAKAESLPRGEKNRMDHRHHAVDAVVVAFTDRSTLIKLSKLRPDDDSRIRRRILGEPWREPGKFRRAVGDSIRAINVSHRVRRRVSGALHEETVYGTTDDPDVFVARKPLSALSASEVPRIRDRVVRDKVVERLAQFGITPGRGGGAIPAAAWQEPLWHNEEKQVPIRKVRLLKPEKSVRPIRGEAAAAKPGSLHHVAIFERADASGNVRRIARYVSLIEAADRLRRHAEIVERIHPDHPDARFVMSLCPGDVLLAEDFLGEESLVLVTTLVSTQQRIHVVDVRDARPSKSRKDVGKTPNSLVCRKVTVDPIGRIRWAGD